MNIWKRYSMRVSKNWVKFNKMFTLSPWLFKYWNATAGFPFRSSFEMEKWVCGLSFWFQTNQKDYFFAVIDNLNTSPSYPQRVNNEITRAKTIVANVRQYEKDEMPVTAENEIKKLFRL
ncbi:hypothetical protein ACB316_21910 [Aeromonas sanarellii]